MAQRKPYSAKHLQESRELLASHTPQELQEQQGQREQQEPREFYKPQESEQTQLEPVSARTYHQNKQQTLLSKKHLRNTSNAFVSLLVVVGLLAVLLPKPNTSDIENRQLSSFPELNIESFTSGSFACDLAVYYSDTFPFREQMILASSWLRGLFGLHGEDNVTLYRNTKSINGEDDILAAAENLPGEFSLQPRASANANFNGEVRNTSSNIVIVDDTALSLYGYYEPALLRYAEVVNNFTERYQEQLKTSVIVVPLYAEFRLPEQYRSMSDNQYDAIATIYNHLSEKVNRVQTYNTLAEHINEYLYFRTDHHWTGLGAWYAYLEFAKSLNMATIPLSDYTTERIDNFLGSLYSAVGGDTALAANPDYAIAYHPPWEVTVSGYETYGGDPAMLDAPLLLTPDEVPGTNKYMIFGYEYPYKVIKTNNHNGHKLIVFRESFANAMIPFLTEQYEEIHVIDFRYFEGDLSRIITEQGITDALFINNMSSAGNDVHVEQLALVTQFQ